MMPGPNSDQFTQSLRQFCEFGSSSTETTDAEIPYISNEFWTASQRKGHPLHEVSYRACFKPQLPEFFINRLTTPGQTVYDPFMGRGTTPLQAAIMGRRPCGNDINPLSKMLVEPRLDPPSESDVRDRLHQVTWRMGGSDRDDLLCFFHPLTLQPLGALREWLYRREQDGPLDNVDTWIRMVALNRLTGHSPGFLSGYTLPPNQAASVASQRRINAKLGLTPPLRDIPAVLMKKTHRLLRLGKPGVHPTGVFMSAAADDRCRLPDSSVDLVVTSPPFLDIVQYADDNWLRCWFAHIEAATVPISMHRTEQAWIAMIRRTLTELVRVVRPGGWIAFEVGEVRKGTVRLEHGVWEAAVGLPLERVVVMVNAQAFTKTSNIWGVGNSEKGTNTNRIVLLRRL